MMPQWEFLDFLRDEPALYPGFQLLMQAQAAGLIEAEGRIAGVRALTPVGEVEIRADLVIGADGRRSALREAGAWRCAAWARQSTCCGYAYSSGPAIRPAARAVSGPAASWP
jgi:2-polyprenyl-6-methoxyphenol hydroxylase-like FAD-dependent oxidoreductase